MEVIPSAVLLAVIDVSDYVCKVAPVLSIYIPQKIGDALTVSTVELSGGMGSKIISAWAEVIMCHGYYPQTRRGGACVHAMKRKKCDTNVTGVFRMLAGMGETRMKPENSVSMLS